MQLVSTEDQLRDRVRVLEAAYRKFPRVSGKTIKEFLTDHTTHCWQPFNVIFQLFEDPEGVLLVRPAVAERCDQIFVGVESVVPNVAEA